MSATRWGYGIGMAEAPAVNGSRQAALPRAIERLGERAPVGWAEPVLSRLARTLTASDARSRWLHGAAIGHRLHPLLTDIPIGAWTAAGVLDVVGGRAARPAARRLIGLGIVAAVPTALTGMADWDGTHGQPRRLGVVHALGNSTALVLQWRSWRARRRGHHLVGVVWSGAALATATASAAIGGHLVYAERVGVDVDVPVVGGDDGEWHATGTSADLPMGKPTRATVGDAPIAVVRTGGRVCAMAATCSHAGGPLDEGEVVGDGLQCPWHASRFALRDGAVQRGPAILAQPVYETNVVDGEVVVRRNRRAHQRA